MQRALAGQRSVVVPSAVFHRVASRPTLLHNHQICTLHKSLLAGEVKDIYSLQYVAH